MPVNGSTSGGGSGNNANSVRAGKAHVELSAKDKGVNASLEKMRQRLLGFGKVTAIVGASMMAGVAPVLGVFAKAASDFTERSTQILTIAKRFGTTTEAVSEMAYAFEQAGVDLMGFVDVTKDWQNKLSQTADGGGMLETFQRIGLDAQKLMQLPLDKQFDAIADAVARIPNPADRSRIMMELLGEAGGKVADIFGQGSNKLKEFRVQARAVGASLPNDEAETAASAGKALDQVWSSLKYTFFAVGSAILPAAEDIKEFAGWVVQLIRNIRSWLQENRNIVLAVVSATAAVGGLGAILTVVGLVTATLATAATGLVIAFKVLAVVIAALALVFSPVGLAFAALAAILLPLQLLIGAFVAANVALIGVGITLVGVLAAIVAAIAIAPFVALVLVIRHLLLNTEKGREILDVFRIGFTILGYEVGKVVGQIGAAIGRFLVFLGKLKDTAVQTFGGISDAIAAGEFKLAMEIALKGGLVAWRLFLVEVQKGWNWFKNWFVEGWHSIGEEIGNVFIDIMESVASTFGDTLDAIFDKISKVAKKIGLDELAEDFESFKMLANDPKVWDVVRGQMEKDRAAARAEREAAREEGLQVAKDELAQAQAALDDATRRAAMLRAANRIIPEAKTGGPPMALPDALRLADKVKGVFSAPNYKQVFNAGDTVAKRQLVVQEQIRDGVGGVKDGVDELKNQWKFA